MSYIIRGKEKRAEWRVREEFGQFGCQAEMSEKLLKSAVIENLQIEPDYEIKLLPAMTMDETLIVDQPIFFVTFQKEKALDQYQYYYDIKQKKWERGQKSKGHCTKIFCFSDEEVVLASDCLKAMDVICQLSSLLNKKLVILLQCHSRLPYFQEESYTKMMMADYSKKYNSLLLWYKSPEHETARVASTYRKKEQCISKKVIREVYGWQQVSEWIGIWLQEDRGAAVSEKDWRNMIPGETYGYRGPFFKEELTETVIPKEVQQIDIGQGQILIYGRKEYLEKWENDQHYEEESPILIDDYEIGEVTSGVINVSQYQGENVFVGLITTVHGDYSLPSLINPDGRSRVVCIWEQEQGDKGNYYTDEKVLNRQVNVIKEPFISEKSNQVTQCLRRIGGKQEGLAQQASFIIAKVNVADERIKEAYGGGSGSVLFGDVMIAAAKLAAIAKVNHKTLVLMMPYRPFLSEMPGVLRWLENFQSIPGQIVVIPGGDKGIEAKCFQAACSKTCETQLFLNIEKETKELSARLIAKHCQIYGAQLYDKEGKSYELLNKKKFDGDKTVIETTGLYQKQNGSGGEILWRMSHIPRGRWQLKIMHSRNMMGQVKVCVEEGASKAHIRIDKANCMNTLNPWADSSLISTGSIMGKEQVLYGFSARGSEREQPFWAVSDEVMGKSRMIGTMEAACVSAGVIACLCEKLINSGRKEKVCSEEIKYEIINKLSHYPEMKYPDKGQGYGILDLSAVCKLLEDEEG